jgi:hypothetical protein
MGVSLLHSPLILCSNDALSGGRDETKAFGPNENLTKA